MDIELGEGVGRKGRLRKKKKGVGGVVTCWSLHHTTVVN